MNETTNTTVTATEKVNKSKLIVAAFKAKGLDTPANDLIDFVKSESGVEVGVSLVNNIRYRLRQKKAERKQKRTPTKKTAPTAAPAQVQESDPLGHYSTRLGCKCHGYKCEGCGKVLYREYVHRAPVRVYFPNDGGMRYINFIIHHYDEASQSLVVYAKPQRGRSLGSLTPEKAADFIKKHREYFQEQEINGKKCLAFYYPIIRTEENVKNIHVEIMETGNPPYKKVKNPKSRWGYDYVPYCEEDRRCCYRMVQLLKGQEFEGDFGFDLPVYDSFSICLTYKHAPAKRDGELSRRIIHAARQVADCGYYYQDGRQAFYEGQLEWMALYVEHFTDLNVKNFRRFLKICKKDGPGFIMQLAQYIEAETGVRQYVENRPNIGNLLVGVSKLAAGESLTGREINAMGYAMRDRKVRDDWGELMAAVKADRELADKPN